MEDEDLESLLQELNRYKDLMANKFREEDDDAQDKADAVIESGNKIEYKLSKIKAVWGIKKQHLEKAMVNSTMIFSIPYLPHGLAWAIKL
ncbi:hypothetical protein FSHL1_004413 [Fusarium sambucinum]